MFKKVILSVIILASSINILSAQNKKSIEIGINGSLMQLERIDIKNISKSPQGYHINFNQHNILIGTGLDINYRLNPYLFIDVHNKIYFDRLGNKNQFLIQTIPALQWRFSKYINSEYFDPYLRIGIGYEYKNFNTINHGQKIIENSEIIKWNNDRKIQNKHSYPIALGLGTNFWFKNNWGLNLHGDYLIRAITKESNSFQVSIGLMYRIGHEKKHKQDNPQPIIEYRNITKYVEVPMYVDKEVIKEVEKPYLCKPLYFEFDSVELLPNQENELNNLANIIKQTKDYIFLITGTADIKGNKRYNQFLALKRANAIKQKLIEKGVPKESLVIRSVGDKLPIVKSNTTHKEREFDRRVYIEPIKMKYRKIINQYLK